MYVCVFVIYYGIDNEDVFCRLETGEEKLLSLLTDWAQLDLSADMEFLEPVYSLRVSGVRLLLDRVISPDISAALHEVLLVTAKSARVSGYYQVVNVWCNYFGSCLSYSAMVFYFVDKCFL